MTIADIIREQTYGVRDTLGSFEQQLGIAKAERDSAEERRRRASTDMSAQNAIERETKQALNQLEIAVRAITQELDEIDRKRREIIDSLFIKQEEQTKKDEELKKALKATEKAHLDIKKEEKARQVAEDEVFKLQSEIKKFQESLTNKVLDCQDIYLANQAEQLQKVFLSREQLAKEKREIEEFNIARHKDPAIAELYDQRVELKKFLANTVVPGVKQVLQASLADVESKISQKFPAAFKTDEPRLLDKKIEELLYYMNNDGNAVLLLPISDTDWESLSKKDGPAKASRILCFWWSLINELKLKSQDVSINTQGKYIALETRFSAEEVAILQEFGLKCENSEVAHFLLTPVPSELQEAICREN